MNKGERALEAARLILDGHTLRQAAQRLGISKSTVHKDIQDSLLNIDANLYYSVRKQLDYNASIRHLRGGEATKKKFEMISKECTKEELKKVNLKGTSYLNKAIR